ncbi:MAG: spondin domain-containing protein [Rhodospirillaceae bacterium]|nr:spondin domain-containing protein [Rhodospirillaceae bacterium]
MTRAANRKSDHILRAFARGLTPAFAVLLAGTLGLGCAAYGDASDDGPKATYTVTYTGAWTTAATPGGVPDGAHFSPLIGGVHNADVAFLEAGGTATAGIESMAERGRTAALSEEIEAAGANALSVLRKDSGSGATDSSTFESVVLTADHPRITLLSMLAPSPDWFVGVFGLSLLDAEGGWVEALTVDLYPYDAGTEEGEEFSFDNAATVPQGTITSLKGTGKFSSDAPMATLTFTLKSAE